MGGPVEMELPEPLLFDEELFGSIYDEPVVEGIEKAKKYKNVKDVRNFTTSNICVICQKEEDQVNIIYTPDACSCIAYCNVCVENNIELKLKRMVVWEKLVEFGTEYINFNDLNLNKLIKFHPFLKTQDLSLKCLLCKTKFIRFLRRTRRNRDTQ